MTKYAVSKQLIKNIKNFLTIDYYSFFDHLFSKSGVFYGWGRKGSGQKAVTLAKKFDTSFVLLEDGFIRSLGLGIDGSPSCSIVEDDAGIYYDSTCQSKLENILASYDFESDNELIDNTRRAIELLVEHNISKYNDAPVVDSRFRNKYKMTESVDEMKHERILVIAQTVGDASLKYGMLDNFSTDDMINTVLSENPNAIVYLKVHPDVLCGKKESDVDIKSAKQKCIIIEENVNPISLLKNFDKVYTKTSQMGFEALLVGCECVCFGMPFYAGWGVTVDRSVCARRTRKLSVEEVFAGAYILYTRYYNPYDKHESNIFEIIETIVKMGKKEKS